MANLSLGKRILFSFVPVALLLLALAGAEAVVRRTSPSASAPLTVTATYDEIDWEIVNRAHLKKYFPASSPLIPEFKPSLFRAAKLPGIAARLLPRELLDVRDALRHDGEHPGHRAQTAAASRA